MSSIRHALVARAPSWLVGLVLLGALLLPRLSELNERFLGIEFVDHYGTQWFYWFTEQQLSQGQGLGATDLFFHPIGKDLYAHTGANMLDAVVALPFRILLGQVLGYNVFVLCCMSLSAVALFRLALAFGGDRSTAGIAALLTATHPFLLQELMEGRPTQAIVVLPALFILLAWRTGLAPGWKTPVLAGVCLAACGYQYWFYALFGGLIAAAMGLWHIVFPLRGAGGRWALLGRHVLMAGTALALTAPVAASLVLRLQGGGEVPGLLDVSSWSLGSVETRTTTGEQAGLFLWQPLRGTFGYYTLLDEGVGTVAERLSGRSWADLCLLLAGGFVLEKGRRGVFLAAVLCVTLVACGPLLVIGDRYLGNPFYLLLVECFGVAQRLWWPGRAYAFVVVLSAGAIAVILGILARRHRGLSWVAAGLLTSASLAALHERHALPFPTWDATIPAAYRCLSEGPPGGVIHLPFHWNQAHLYYQTAHGRPMLGGMRDEDDMFIPLEWRRLRDGNAFMQALITGSSALEPRLVWPPEDLAAVGALGFRYLVLRLDSWEPERGDLDGLIAISHRNQRRRLRLALIDAFGLPVYADARTEIYLPWGGGAPCHSESVQADEHFVGHPDYSLATGFSDDTQWSQLAPMLSAD